MVTGDLNAALVEWVVQYRISDPVKFLFEVREPSETLRYVSESVMREVVGDRTVDEVITIGRQEIETEALTKMQSLSTKYAMGISIDQVQLKNINPPEPVQESFNEVNQAQQEKEKLINEARRDYNKVIPLAEGEKYQRIREADGYRLKRVNEAEGDVARFSALLAEYRKAPEVTRRRIYIETLQDVMPGIRSKIIIDEQARSILPLLRGQSPPWEADFFAQYRMREDHAEGADMRSYQTERWKLVRFLRGRRGSELYDRLNDPGETRNLFGSSDPSVRDAIRALDGSDLGGRTIKWDPVKEEVIGDYKADQLLKTVDFRNFRDPWAM